MVKAGVVLYLDSELISKLSREAEANGLNISMVANTRLQGSLASTPSDLNPSSFRLTADNDIQPVEQTEDLEGEWNNIIEPYVFRKDEAGKKLFNTLGQRAVLDFKNAMASILKLEGNASPSKALVLRRCIEQKGELARRYETLLKRGGGQG